MRVYGGDPAIRVAVYSVLCRVPESLRRRFHSGEIAVASVGRAAAGIFLPPTALNGAREMIVLFEYAGTEATFGHEAAHAYLGHDAPSEENEIAAASLTRSWGFGGNSADPEGCAERYRREEEKQSAPWLMPVVEDVGFSFECIVCSARCRVIAPTVPGLDAKVAIQCVACSRVGEKNIATLLVQCPTCSERPTAVWSDDAIPSAPVFTIACGCGPATLRVICEPAMLDEPGDDESEERWACRTALRMLKRARTSPERAFLWQAENRLRRAAASRGGTTRERLNDLAQQVAVVRVEGMDRERLDRVIADLDELLALVPESVER